MTSPPTPLQNPLKEHTAATKTADPCILVIFGSTGDLTARKLMPALYNLAVEGQLPTHYACVGFARRPKDHEQFRQEMQQAVCQHSRMKPSDDQQWQDFSDHLFYHRSEFDNDDGYRALHTFLNDLDQKLGTRGNRVFYLSTQPGFFPLIVEKLHQHGLLYDAHKEKQRWSRVIIEKPFGYDVTTALALQHHLTRHLSESQVYRIDHYLGKETVQNLLTFRFANSIFESLWNNRHVDHVQITVAEELGIGTRGHFFEGAGMLRDIVQNHMMQLLSLVAMEPPVNLTAHAIRDEKEKVVESIRPITVGECSDYVIRGQYGPGFINGESVDGYRQENDVDAASNVETFVALKLFVDNWRWAGVPFYLRAGKRLPKRATEIAVTFKDAPGVLFQQKHRRHDPNVLVIRIQPDEGISLRTNCKIPGLGTLIQPVKMDFRYGSYFGATPPEAYERLICDCMAGDSTLFARDDEVLASWRLLTPILQYWKENPPDNFPNYPAGSWGPDEANNMLTDKNRAWRLM